MPRGTTAYMGRVYVTMASGRALKDWGFGSTSEVPTGALWNGNVVILTKLLSLAALEAVILATSITASVETFVLPLVIIIIQNYLHALNTYSERF